MDFDHNVIVCLSIIDTLISHTRSIFTGSASAVVLVYLVGCSHTGGYRHAVIAKSSDVNPLRSAQSQHLTRSNWYFHRSILSPVHLSPSKQAMRALVLCHRHRHPAVHNLHGHGL